MAECSSREAVEKEQIAEARIEGVKVRRSIVICTHTHQELDARYHHVVGGDFRPIIIPFWANQNTIK